jgi:DNA polymerase III delta prime subunit
MNKNKTTIASMFFMVFGLAYVENSYSMDMEQFMKDSPNQANFGNPSQPSSLLQKGLLIGLGFGINLGVHTVSTAYNVVLQQAVANWYHNWGAKRKAAQLTIPKRDPCYVFPNTINDVIAAISNVDINEETVYEENELDQDRKHYILYGPAGTGKSSAPRQVAADLGAYYMSYEASQLANIVESLGLHFTKTILNEIKHAAKKAQKENKRVVVLWDEIDSLGSRVGGKKDNTKNADVVSALLTLVPKLPKNVILMATTNFYYKLDDAFSQRFEDVKFAFPDLQDRQKILNEYSKTFPMYDAGISYLPTLARITPGFSQRNIAGLFNNAKNSAKIKKHPAIHRIHLREQYKTIAPKVVDDIAREETTYKLFMAKKKHLLNDILCEKLEGIQKSLQEHMTELQNDIKETKDDDEKGKEKVPAEDSGTGTSSPKKWHALEGEITQPLVPRIMQKQEQSWFKRYLSSSLSLGSKVLTHPTAYVSYGGLGVAVGAHFYIKYFLQPKLSYSY